MLNANEKQHFQVFGRGAHGHRLVYTTFSRANALNGDKPAMAPLNHFKRVRAFCLQVDRLGYSFINGGNYAVTDKAILKKEKRKLLNYRINSTMKRDTPRDITRARVLIAYNSNFKDWGSMFRQFADAFACIENKREPKARAVRECMRLIDRLNIKSLRQLNSRKEGVN